MTTEKPNTEAQSRAALAECRAIFASKLEDYGASWRILRPSSLTDQLYIKAKRIRSLETKKVSLVGEGIRPEFCALINYGIVGLIQTHIGFADATDIDAQQALSLYDQYAEETLQLMLKKNHDYDEAWRSMRVSSYTDFIQAAAYQGDRRQRRRDHRVGRSGLQLYGHHQLRPFRPHQAQ